MDNIDELATNRADLIDKALLRPGRFDLIIELHIPDYDTRLSILKIHCKTRHLDSDISLDELAKRTAGMTGADLAGLCHRVAMLAIKESIEKHPENQFTDFSIKKSHFETVLSSIQKKLKCQLYKHKRKDYILYKMEPMK